MGELTEMTVTMDATAWNAVAGEAESKAVAVIAGGKTPDRYIQSAALLRAAATFRGHANMMEMLDGEPDTATVTAWDLTDEGCPGEVVPAP